MTINPLTGHNTSPLTAPRLGVGELWFFYSIYKDQRNWLHKLAGAHALGELDLPAREHGALIGDLRKVHSITKGLGAAIDNLYTPHIERIMAEPEAVHRPKVIELPPPKRRRGRPKGSKDKRPRQRRKGATVTAPDPKQVKRKPGRPRKLANK